MKLLFENNILFVKRREQSDKRKRLMATLSAGLTKRKFSFVKMFRKSVGDDSKMHLIIFITLDISQIGHSWILSLN